MLLSDWYAKRQEKKQEKKQEMNDLVDKLAGQARIEGYKLGVKTKESNMYKARLELVGSLFDDFIKELESISPEQMEQPDVDRHDNTPYAGKSHYQQVIESYRCWILDALDGYDEV